MTAIFAQLALVFAGIAFLIQAGAFFARIREPQGGKRPVLMFCFVEGMIFFCALMFLVFRFGTSNGISAFLVPAFDLVLIVNLPVLAAVWIAQEAAKGKQKDKTGTRNP